MKIQPLIPLCSTLGIVLGSSITFAQTAPPSTRIPVADSTLGTQVSVTNNNFTITGGVSRGQNLFQSFQDFSVPTGGAATFINPVGNRSIITRVTGNLFSDIDGTINTQGANFFLINPNGMVFGANTRLNVGQTFVGSTANGIDLVDAGGNAYRFGTNGNGDAPLLTINPNALLTPARLIMGGGNGGIVNNGTLQTNNPSQYIGLLGGDVNLNGGGIVTPGGRVDLGGLKSAGTVTATDKGWVFSGDNLVRGDVSLTNGAVVSVSAQNNLGNVNPLFGNSSSAGSSINITANNVNLINNLSTSNTAQSNLQAGLGANTVTTVPAGDININATGKVTLDRGGVYQVILAGAQGQIGDIKIDATSLDLKNQSTIYSFTAGQGNAGNINVKNSSNVTVKDNSSIQTANIGGKGDTGKIILDTTGDIILSDRASISSAIVPASEGNSQGIEIKNARNLTLTNGSAIGSNNLGGTGNAGNIDIKITGNIDVTGVDPQSTLFQLNPTFSAQSVISSSTLGKGNAGKITLDTTGNITLSNQGVISSEIAAKAEGNSQGIEIKNARNLTLTNGSTIGTENLGGVGNAGNIDIKTTGNINITGVDPQSTLFQSNPNWSGNSLSFISSTTAGKGNAGKITLDTTSDITLNNRGYLFSTIASTAEGNSQGIEIKNIRNLTLYNQSLISTDTYGTGKAGSIDIKATGDINIIGVDSQNPSFSDSTRLAQSSISTDTFGQGDTGKITLDTTGDITLFNGGKISSVIGETASGNGQGIDIKNTRNLTLTNQSIIATSNVGGTGKSGNIDIKTTGNINITGADSQSSLFQNNPNLLAQSTISSDTSGKGDTGKITLNVSGDITLSNRGIISSAFGRTAQGNSQGIEIKNARNLNLENSSIIFSNTFGKGNAGNIDIKTTDNINITGVDSTISSSSSGEGKAANISLSSKQVNLDNRGFIQTSANSVSGGDINLALRERLLMRKNSGITTASGSTQTQSQGGNININVPFIITAPNENSDISANGFSGSGGKVTINSQQNFWILPLSRAELEQRLGTTDSNQLNPGNLQTNDITAISQVNPNLNGQVTIAPPEIDPSRGLSPLPNSVTDPSNRINPNCSPKAIGNNSFTSVGRGGIPASPKDPLNEEQIATNWVRLNPQDKLPSAPITPPSAQSRQPFSARRYANDSAQGKPIVEAQAWRREQNGDILLAAQSTPNGSFPQSQPAASCATR